MDGQRQRKDFNTEFTEGTENGIFGSGSVSISTGGRVAYRHDWFEISLMAPAVLRFLQETAKWDPRPSPKPRTSKTGIVTGRGVACVAYERDNGFSAMVAEVEVNQDTGKVSVKHIVLANDSGPISNPDGLRNQIEGGTLQGMSRALMEEVTWDDQKVTSFDWRTYRTLPLGFDVPKIEAVLVDRHPDEPACGAGETAITVVAAAIGNAIFDATGARIRQVPFTPERVKAALSEVS